ncbi:unnamed protein product [Urochloa humidicola]
MGTSSWKKAATPEQEGVGRASPPRLLESRPWIRAHSILERPPNPSCSASPAAPLAWSASTLPAARRLELELASAAAPLPRVGTAIPAPGPVQLDPSLPPVEEGREPRTRAAGRVGKRSDGGARTEKTRSGGARKLRERMGGG